MDALSHLHYVNVMLMHAASGRTPCRKRQAGDDFSALPASVAVSGHTRLNTGTFLLLSSRVALRSLSYITKPATSAGFVINIFSFIGFWKR